MEDVTDMTDLRKCPMCAELIKKKATLCKHCRSQISPESRAEPETDAAVVDRLGTNQDSTLPKPAIKKPQPALWKNILLVCIVLGMVAVGLLIRGAGSNIDTSNGTGAASGPGTSSNSEVNGKTFSIGGTIKTLPITFRLDRGVVKDYLETDRPYKASPGTAYLVIYFTARNDGYEPFTPSANQIVITTSDGRSFEPDFQITHDLRNAEHLEWELQIQPGLEKQTAVVFQLPIQELKNNPIAHVGKGGDYSGEIALFPDQNRPAQTVAPVAPVEPVREPDSVSKDNTESMAPNVSDVAPPPNAPISASNGTGTSTVTSVDETVRPESGQSSNQTTDQEVAARKEKIEKLETTLKTIRADIEKNDAWIVEKQASIRKVTDIQREQQKQILESDPNYAAQYEKRSQEDEDTQLFLERQHGKELYDREQQTMAELKELGEDKSNDKSQ